MSSTFLVGIDDLEVTCSLRDPRFVGSNATKDNRFYEDVKVLSRSPPEGRFKA